MKNKIIFVILLVICSCQSNMDDEQTSKDYIEIDMQGRSVGELSLEEEKLYIEARSRFDKIVKYDNGQYYLTEINPNHLNISPELYRYFKSIMDYTNSITKEENVGSVTTISTTLPVRIKTRNEFNGQTNVNGIVQYWYGFDVYLSNSALNQIAAGASLTSVISGYIPHPVAKAISAACGLTGALSSLGAAFYPNGIIISFSYAPVPGGCIPYNINAQ